MALQSQLLRGDPKLEAAAVSDPAHIKPGATGEHVRKIQLALVQLDGAPIARDGIYGPATAAAVLAYKQKRNIVNRNYQTQADNIVGKMTMAALDAEMRGFETGNTRPPRIVAMHPNRNESYRSSAVHHFRPFGSRASERSAKTETDRWPQLVFPGGPFQVMELQENRFGGFQVIDGVGGTVRCLNDSVGRVVDPNEPLAHGGMMRVTKSPQPFSVLARGIGQTYIEAIKPESPFGDTFTLVVVAPSTKLTWKPQWTPKKTDRMRCNPWAFKGFSPAFPEVPGVMLKSPLFEFTGTVAPDATVPLDDFELGIVQAVIQSSMKADYVDENGRVTWTCTIRAPASRDSADDSPIWYDKDSVKSLNAAEGRTVSSNDSPQNVVPWQTKDKKGALVATSGADVLCTWLAARQKSTGTFTFLCWAMWSIDWGCTFDFKQNTRTLTGREGITESHDGQGPYTPITAGKSANEQISMVWSGPPGGF